MDFTLVVTVIFSILFGLIVQRLFGAYRRHIQNRRLKNNNLNDISKAGGLIPYIRQAHGFSGSYGLVEFYMGETNRYVSIIDPILIKQTVAYSDRPIHLFEFIEPLIGKDNLQIYTGERAAKLRKLTTNSTGLHVFRQKYDLLVNTVNEVIIDDWNQKCKHNEPVMLQQSLLKFGLVSIISLLSGMDMPLVDANKFKQAYDGTMSALFDKKNGICNEKGEKGIKDSIEFLQSYFKELLHKRQTLLDVSVGDFCEFLLTAHDPDTGKPFREDQKLSHLSVYLLAGYHTTAVAASWTLFALAQYPNIYKRVKEEIDDVIREHDATQNDLEQLKYLECVIKESLRVYPPGLFVARLATEDIQLTNGYLIEKNTTIFYPVFLIHKHSKYWSKPDEFNPERFTQTITPYSYMPFGHGTRICPGEKLARQELRLVLAMIIKNFDFELDMNPRDVEFDERFVLLAKNDIKIKLTSRKI